MFSLNENFTVNDLKYFIISKQIKYLKSIKWFLNVELILWKITGLKKIKSIVK